MSDSKEQRESQEKASDMNLNSSSSLPRSMTRDSDLNTAGVFTSRYETEVRHVGDVLNEQWQLVRFIYHGALGEIWEGRNIEQDLRVVIKFIPSDICYYQTELDNLRSLFGQLRSLDHPSINPVYFFGNDPKAGWYFVSGMRNGKKLVKWFHDTGEGESPFTQEQSIQIIESLSLALDHAFSKGIVHNDVNPATIVVDLQTDGSVKACLTDFGLAASLRQSTMRISLDMTGVGGASPYMAPEQWRGRQLDGRADQYGLAATAYQMFSGYRPFVANSFDELRERILNTETPPIPNVPGHINRALRKALAKDATNRFKTCDEFVAALRDPHWQDSRSTTWFVRAAWWIGGAILASVAAGILYGILR